MKFEELAGIWNNADAGLEQHIKINRSLVKNIAIRKVRSGLYEVKFTAIVGIIAGIFFSMFLWRFIIDNYIQLKFFIPALILLLTTMFGLIIAIYRLVLVYTLNPEATVFESQQKLIRLQKLDILDIYSLYVIIPLFTAPFLIVVAKAFAHIDLYSFFNMRWLIYLTGGSIIIAVILIFFLKKYPAKRLAKSVAFLNELKED